MRNKSSRRTFLQAGLVLPATGLVIPPLSLEAAFQQPTGQPAPKMPEPSGYPDSGKYGKYIIKEPYVKYHQLENITVTPKQLMADCIITHQVFYKLERIVGEPMAHDFVQIIGFIGTNPMNCREFDAEIEFCLGDEREKHIINTPTVVSIAKGLMHGPIEIKRINKPFIFLEIMLTAGYSTMVPKPKPPA
jgi:hypothetical protein